MIVGGHMSGDVLFLDVAEPMQPTITRSVSLGGGPWHPSFLPGGERVAFPAKMANAVAILDATDGSEIATISGHGVAEPHGRRRASGRTIHIRIQQQPERRIHAPVSPASKRHGRP